MRIYDFPWWHEWHEPLICCEAWGTCSPPLWHTVHWSVHVRIQLSGREPYGSLHAKGRSQWCSSTKGLGMSESIVNIDIKHDLTTRHYRKVPESAAGISEGISNYFRRLAASLSQKTLELVRYRCWKIRSQNRWWVRAQVLQPKARAE